MGTIDCPCAGLIAFARNVGWGSWQTGAAKLRVLTDFWVGMLVTGWWLWRADGPGRALGYSIAGGRGRRKGRETGLAQTPDTMATWLYYHEEGAEFFFCVLCEDAEEFAVDLGCTVGIHTKEDDA